MILAYLHSKESSDFVAESKRYQIFLVGALNKFLLVTSNYHLKIDLKCVRFEVFTAVTMKKAVFWDVAPCRSGV
jgi:hypothetical protein